MFSFSAARRRPLVHTLPLSILLGPLVLLAVFTVTALFLHSDVNVAMLWSQCHSHARIPALSRIPLIGTPLCGLTSFFHAALDSYRTTALMGVILSYVGAVCTACHLESARPCNVASRFVRNPTWQWLLFNLLGGAAVWQLLIVPGYLICATGIFASVSPRAAAVQSEAGADAASESELVNIDKEGDYGRRIPDAEVVAIPAGVILGFYVPSIAMLATNSYASIVVWLFFPLHVGAVRILVRSAITKLRRSDASTVYPESSLATLAIFYAVPVVFSILAHVLVIWNSALRDDRTEMTRSTIKFIEIDFLFIAATILYWMLVEVGWEVPLVMVAASIAIGPGGGVCVGWLLRDKLMYDDLAAIDSDLDEDITAEPTERTSLLQ